MATESASKSIQIFDVPLYGVRFHLIVADDIVAVRKEFASTFGESDTDATWDAMCSSHNGSFGLFFAKSALKYSVIGHEIFHLTHRIMEFIGDTFTPNHHEPYAYLNGWLHETVMKSLTKEKFEIR